MEFIYVLDWVIVERLSTYDSSIECDTVYYVDQVSAYVYWSDGIEEVDINELLDIDCVHTINPSQKTTYYQIRKNQYEKMIEWVNTSIEETQNSDMCDSDKQKQYTLCLWMKTTLERILQVYTDLLT